MTVSPDEDVQEEYDEAPTEEFTDDEDDVPTQEIHMPDEFDDGSKPA
jgi:hypothetical protein